MMNAGELLDQTARSRAVDGAISALVQAPAGSGKTTLLVERYLALLAQSRQPEEVLAITFTRKAAQEMRSRVLKALTEDTHPDVERIHALSRHYHWDLHNNPQRLRIQTIDAFAAGLNHSLPFNAGQASALPPTDTAAHLYRLAVDRLFERATEGTPVATLLLEFIADNDNAAEAAKTQLVRMLPGRDQWLDVVVVISAMPDQAEREVLFAEGLRNLLTQVEYNMREWLPDHLIDELVNLSTLVSIQHDNLLPDWLTMLRVLITQNGTLRSRLTVREGFDTKVLRDRGKALIDALAPIAPAEQIAMLPLLPASAPQPEDTARLGRVCDVLVLAVQALSEVFLEAGQCDFTEILLSSRRALRSTEDPTELALALDYRIRHILVDEFQDTSAMQLALFAQLIETWNPGDGNSFFAVGDPMQSIYSFRDADVGRYLAVKHNRFFDLPLESVSLQMNFRSTPALVNWCNDTFRAMLGTREDDVLGVVAHAPSVAHATLESPAPVLRRYADSISEARSIAGYIRTLRVQEPGSKIAVLVRNRTHISVLVDALNAANVTWRGTDMHPLSRVPAIQDIHNLFLAIADPENRLAWLTLLRSPMVGCTLMELDTFAEMESIPDALQSAADSAPHYTRAAQAMARARMQRHERPARQLLEECWLILGGRDVCNPNELDEVERYLTLLDDLGTSLLDVEVVERRVAALYAADQSAADVELLTIHKAKGLEFDHVIIPFCNRGSRAPEKLPLHWRLADSSLLMATHDQPLKIWLQAENSTRERNELKRLLYVAATRAKGSLLITTAADSRLHFRSFEKLLIDAGCEFEDVEVPATAPANNAGTEGTVTSVADIRLAGDYVFSPLLHDLPGSHAGAEFGEQVEAQREQDDGVFEAACGEVIHKALYRMAIVASACADARDDFAAYVSRWRPRWQAELHALGVSPERLTEAFSRVTRQLDTVLSSDLACAVLAHSDAAFAEFELTSRNATGDAAVNLRIDRICMLGGQRWVIDYKSGNGNSVAFFSAQATRYRPQLERYAHAASHYFGEPVRQGILFTATGTLWDVEADTQVHDLSLP